MPITNILGLSIGDPSPVISYVASSSTVYNTSTTISVTLPADIQEDDLILAAVFTRGTLTTPSGWTLEDSQLCTKTGDTSQTLSILSKTADGTEGSTSLNLTQSSVAGIRFGVCVSVFRKAGAGAPSVLSTAKVGVDDTVTNSVSIPSVTATANGQMAFSAATDVLANTAPDTTTVAVSSPWTRVSVGTVLQNRLGAAYQALSISTMTGGSFTWTSLTPATTAVASINALIG